MTMSETNEVLDNTGEGGNDAPVAENLLMTGGKGEGDSPSPVDFSSYLNSLPDGDRELLQKNGVDSFEKQSKWINGLNTVLGKKGLVAPGEDATEEEISAYKQSLYKEIGVPEDGEYEFTLPEGTQEEYVSQEFLDELAGVAQEKGINNEAFQAVIDKIYSAYNEMISGALESQPNIDSLKSEWGINFDKNLKVASNFFNKVSDVEGMQDMAERYGNDPTIIKAFYNLAAQNGEDILSQGKGSTSQSVDDIRKQAIERLTKANELAKMGDYKQAELIKSEANSLYEQLARMS